MPLNKAILMTKAISPGWYVWRIIIVLCVVAGSLVYLTRMLGREVVSEGYYVGEIQTVRTFDKTHSTHWVLKVEIPGRAEPEIFTLLRPPEPKVGMKIPIKQYFLDDGTEVLTLDVITWQSREY